jgi:hypothetical protein
LATSIQSGQEPIYGSKREWNCDKQHSSEEGMPCFGFFVTGHRFSVPSVSPLAFQTGGYKRVLLWGLGWVHFRFSPSVGE